MDLQSLMAKHGFISVKCFQKTVDGTNYLIVSDSGDEDGRYEIVKERIQPPEFFMSTNDLEEVERAIQKL